jgi:hypothetical protein
VTELSDLLVQLESAWEEHGFSPAEWLAPGIDHALAREAIAGVSGSPCQEALDWFGWHNGSIDDRTEVELAPSGFTLLSIEQSLAERAVRIEGAMALAELPPDPLPVSVFWRDSWLPIGRMSTAAVLVVDLAADTTAAPVYNVDWQNLTSPGVPATPSLADAVTVWLSVLAGGYYQWAEGFWHYDFSAVPKEFRRSRLVG